MLSVSRVLGCAAAVLATAGLTVGQPAYSGGPKGPVPGKPGNQNIVEIAQAVNADNGQFSYLLAAATCEYFGGAVVDLLTGSDKYTLFAPTDEAFIALQTTLGIAEPSPELTCTLPQETLFDVLAYHVTDGRRFSNSVFNRNAVKMVEMLNGQYVITNPNRTLNDIAGQSVTVVPTLVNINASNGVIHVINSVLLPFTP